MQAQLLLGLVPVNGTSLSFAPLRRRRIRARRNLWAPLYVVAGTSSSGEQNHYAVLGLKLSATSADVKRAYRLLARRYHPDVSKDLQSPEIFKSINHAYQVLSNEATRNQYDHAVKVKEDTFRQNKTKKKHNPEFNIGVRIHRSEELKRRMRNKRRRNFYSNDGDEESEKNPKTNNRSSFTQVLLSSLICLFLFCTLGSQISLAFSFITALFNGELESGYKLGFGIAFVLGGTHGVLVALCLSFASWLFEKISDVCAIIAAVWVCANLVSVAPIPQGAILTLLYMSIKLQVDMN